MTVKKHARIVPDWQTADPTTAVFSRIRENGLHGETKRTRLKGTQLRLNSVDPAMFTHTGGARGPVRVLFVSSSSRSLRPYYALSIAFQPPASSPSSSSRLLSLGRVLRETLFGPFDSLILSPLFPFFSFSFPFVAEALALQVSAAPTSRAG